jgi:hypothetical protein
MKLCKVKYFEIFFAENRFSVDFVFSRLLYPERAGHSRGTSLQHVGTLVYYIINKYIIVQDRSHSVLSTRRPAVGCTVCTVL